MEVFKQATYLKDTLPPQEDIKKLQKYNGSAQKDYKYQIKYYIRIDFKMTILTKKHQRSNCNLCIKGD